MSRLKYADFIDEVLDARGVKKTELASRLGVPAERLYEMLEGKHCPNAALAKAVERELGIQQLAPEYYGWGSERKPS